MTLHLKSRTRFLLTYLCVVISSLTISTGFSHGYKLLVLDRQIRQSVGENTDLHREFVETFEEVSLQGSLLALLSGSAIALGLSRWVGKQVTDPVESLTRSVLNLSKGNFAVDPLPGSAIQEIVELEESVRTAAERLHQAEKQRSVVTGEVAHELRAPLCVIQGWVELLCQQGAIGSADEQRLLREVNRLKRLVSDLLDLTKLDAKQVSLQAFTVAPLPLLQEVVNSFAESSAASRCAVPGLEVEDLPPVVCDPDRTRQILINLIGNAIAHTPADGSVTIRAEASQDFLWVSVTDTGCGIAPDDLPYVFERFWQADRRKRAGNGIGLAIAKRLVELQRGAIEVRSKLGEGSTFRFSVPLHLAS